MSFDEQSLKARAAKRREELHRERTYVLPVTGYDDIYAARYRGLTYEEFRRVGRLAEKQQYGSEDEQELNSYADVLVSACVEVLGVDGENSYVSLAGKPKWSAETARDWFGLDLPEGVTPRDALRAVIPGLQLAFHMQAYQEQLENVLPEVGKQLEGESVASQAA